MVNTRFMLAALALTTWQHAVFGQMINLSDVFSAGQSIANDVFASSSTNLGALATAGGSILSGLETATASSAQSTRASTSKPTTTPAPTSSPAISSSTTPSAAAAATAPPATESPSSQQHDNKRLAIILGVILGFLALLALLALLWLCLRHRRRQQRKKRASTNSQVPLAESKHSHHASRDGDHDLEKAAPLPSQPLMQQHNRPSTSTGSSSKPREHTDWPWAGSTTRSTAYGGAVLIPNRDHSRDHSREHDRKSDHEYHIAPAIDNHYAPATNASAAQPVPAPVAAFPTPHPSTSNITPAPIPVPIPAPSKAQRRSISHRSSMDPVTEEPEHETFAAAADPFMGETRPERERRRSTSLPPPSLKPNFNTTTSASGPVIVTNDQDQHNAGGLVHPALRPQMGSRTQSGSGRFYAAVPVATDDRRSPEHQNYPHTPNDYPSDHLTTNQSHSRDLLSPGHTFNRDTSSTENSSVSPLSDTSASPVYGHSSNHAHNHDAYGTPLSPAELPTLPNSPTAPTAAAAPAQNTGVKRTPSYRTQIPDVPLPRRSSKRERSANGKTPRHVKLLSNEEAGGFQFDFNGGSGDERGRLRGDHDSESDGEFADAEDGSLIHRGPWSPATAQDRSEMEKQRRGAKSRGRGDYEMVHGADDEDEDSPGAGATGGDIGNERGRRQSITRKPVPTRRAGNVVGTAPAA